MSKHDPDQDTRIRQRAYFLWLADGCPEGRAAEHWRRAAEAEAAAASNRMLDEEGEETFPASDPPSHSGITGVVGRD